MLVDSGHADYQDQPSFLYGKSFDDRARCRGGGSPAPDARAAGGVRAGLRVKDAALVGIPTPEVRASAMAGLMDTRVSASWPGIARAGIPILLLLATEPPETGRENEAAAKVFAERFPEAEIRFFESAGHDLFSDVGPELGVVVAEWAGRLPPRRRDPNGRDRGGQAG